MVDTLRDLSDLQALLADNSSGDISPQDLRDFLYSMKRPHGSLMMVTPAPASVLTPGTYYKAQGVTQLCTQTEHYLFDHPANNRLRYIGIPDIHAHIACTIGMTQSGTNDTLGFKLAKNGTLIDHSYTPRFVSTGTDVGSTALHSDFMLSTNDYVELWVTNESAVESITVVALYLFALGMFV